MSFSVEQLSAQALRAVLPDFVRLLQDSVEGGASVGFLPPLSMDEAASYWDSVQAGVQDGGRVLLVARQNNTVVGSVQLALERRPNGRHRAEVQKLLVHSAARRQGIARALMDAIEAVAREHGISLLVLDTLRGGAAEQLYRQIGYVEAGVIPQYARGADGALHATVVFYRMV